eukprot:424961_1
MSTNWNQDRISCLVTAIIASISFIGVFYVFISILLMRIQKYKHNKSRHSKHNTKVKQSNIILHTHIFYVSICGIFNYGLLVANFLPFTITNNYTNIYPSPLCQIIGFVIQVAPATEAMWLCLISITLTKILHHKWTILHLNTNLKYHHIMIWSIAFIIGIIPIFGNAYGASSVAKLTVDDNLTATQCWIKDEENKYFLSLYIPMLLMMVIDIYCLYKSYKIIKYIQEKSLSTYILKKCFLFVLIYVIIWIPPMILRFVQVSHKKWKVSFWFLLIHHINISLPGIITCLIWTSMQSFTSLHINLYLLCCDTGKKSKKANNFVNNIVSASPHSPLLESPNLSPIMQIDQECSSFQSYAILCTLY